jgi:hypothetical protein
MFKGFREKQFETEKKVILAEFEISALKKKVKILEDKINKNDNDIQNLKYDAEILKKMLAFASSNWFKVPAIILGTIVFGNYIYDLAGQENIKQLEKELIIKTT